MTEQKARQPIPIHTPPTHELADPDNDLSPIEGFLTGSGRMAKNGDFVNTNLLKKYAQEGRGIPRVFLEPPAAAKGVQALNERREGVVLRGAIGPFDLDQIPTFILERYTPTVGIEPVSPDGVGQSRWRLSLDAGDMHTFSPDMIRQNLVISEDVQGLFSLEEVRGKNEHGQMQTFIELVVQVQDEAPSQT